MADWLLTAPKITRDQAPFYWTYLDRPQDGTILLVWQSMSLGTDFPSDGYVYPPLETAFQLEVTGGYTLEMYHHKAGFSPGEPVATHSRRRYRLLPSKYPNINGPTPDLSLWIVHYSQCDPQERIPSQLIQIDLRIQSTMQTRAFLNQQGQLVQKEFMLHDRANWPQIQFPRGPARGPQMYNSNVPQGRIPQSMAYPPQHQPGPPPKRVRTQHAVPNAAPGSTVAVLDVDDEEDTQRGDFFDHTTPREVSTARYKQNHEWMEEILSSPYGIHQIIPADLGLGMRGELGNLTDGIFDAPYNPENDVEKNVYVGSLDPEKAEQFRTRATERIAETNKEIEKMKRKHAKRLAKFQKGSLLSLAEKELRTAVANPSDVGPEYWRLEGRIDEDDSEDSEAVTKVPSRVEDILAQVEASLGRHAVAVQELRRIQDGGFEEAAAVASPSPIPAEPTPTHLMSDNSLPLSVNGGTPQTGVLGAGGDMDIDNSAASLLDQYRAGLSAHATPGSTFDNTPQAYLQTNSSTGTPATHIPSPQPAAHVSPQPQIPVTQEDVNMSEGNEQTIFGQPHGTDDWVVVPPGGVSPLHSTFVDQPPSTSEPTTAPITAPTIPILSPNPTINAESTPLPDSSTSPNDFADLGDLDTAGDAMASYDDMGEDGGDMGDLALDLDSAMDDSAFGEAFHGVESRDEDGGEENAGDGM